SLAFAVVLGGVVSALLFRAPEWRGRRLTVWLFLSLANASHGVLDAINTALTAIAFFAPFDNTRYFLPWRPIPVAPFAFRFFSARGLVVFEAELLMISLHAAIVAGVAWAVWAPAVTAPGEERESRIITWVITGFVITILTS